LRSSKDQTELVAPLLKLLLSLKEKETKAERKTLCSEEISSETEVGFLPSPEGLFL